MTIARCTLNVEETVARYIAREHLLDADALHLVALSGGADSVALLLVMLRLGYRVEAVHCNFHLRGEESNRDEKFVQTLCEDKGVAIHLIHFDTETYANLHKVSIEMAARQLRYGYFEQLRQDTGAADVCVAHHRDDTVETVLMNLVRGTGIHGLTGIRPRNGNIVRPLLCVSRSEIEHFLKKESQAWVTDSTNLVADVLRNKLRLHVVPQLNQLWQGASEAIARTACHLSEAEKVFDEAIARQMQAVCKVQGDVTEVSVPELLACPSPESVVHELLSPHGFSATQCMQVMECVEKQAVGRQFLSANSQVVIDRGRLFVAPLPKEQPVLRIVEEGVYVYGERKVAVSVSDHVEVSRQLSVATLDADLVSFPLTIRPIVAGDRFLPFGMRGQKLVSDYLTDSKVPLVERQRQLVVTAADGGIVWLVGRRTDQRFAITDATKRMIRLEMRI